MTQDRQEREPHARPEADLPALESEAGSEDSPNWVDGDASEFSTELERGEEQLDRRASPTLRTRAPVAMVETAFLASTASLIWLINYYFPLGPVLRIVFPLPIALLYLRRGARAAWMAALVSGLLLSILMGPNRSMMFVMPYGLMGVQLGAVWRRGLGWWISIATGTVLGTMGFFFRFWILSVLLGEDLWIYTINQITNLAEWFYMRLGLLAQPEPLLIEAIALGAIIFSNLMYLFVVHLVALLLFDRLRAPIPRPPEWVQALVEYDY
ncbi:MAG: DUF2232 domain-containing protein [Cyanobacteriota bacterium]|nr:DUF2232 domain-containing protein [Cyanobacteriota bacterium]